MDRAIPRKSTAFGVTAAIALIAALTVLPAPQAQAVDIPVTDATELQNALTTAVAGDVIQVDGTITGNFTIDKAITLTSLTTGSGTITGTLTVADNGAYPTISGLTLQANATAGVAGTAIRLQGASAHANIRDNTILNGSNLISVTGVRPTGGPFPAVQIWNNSFSAFATPAQDNAIWLSNAQSVLVQGNTFSNDGTSVAVNLAGGSSDVVIEGNTISGVANAVVAIANGAAPSSSVTIRNNTVSGVAYPLFFGGENLSDITIEGNALSNVSGSAIHFGSTAWDSGSGAPISDVNIVGNTVTDAATGISFTGTANVATAGITVASNNTFTRVATLVSDPDGEVGAGNVVIVAGAAVPVPGTADYTG